MASTASNCGRFTSPVAADVSLLQRHGSHFRGLPVLNPLGLLNRKELRLGAANLRQPSGAVVTVVASLAGHGASLSGPENLADGDGRGGTSVPSKLQDDTAPMAAADGFFVENDDELDLDRPSEGFSSIPEAIEDIRRGKYVIVVDDEDRENQGDLVMAGSLVTPDAIAFIVRHGTGIVCVGMKEDDVERLQLPLMVSKEENEEKLYTAFTVSVDVKVGTTTGVSAEDRPKTILALASPASKAEDFNRPGHIFPIKYRKGGVLRRAGHTEASVDLLVLAG